MDVFSSYATNADAEENGRWFEFGDVELLIGRSGNRLYSEGIQAQFLAHKHTLDQKDTPEAIRAGNARAEQIQILVMSRSILLGWRGLPKKGPDGVPLEVDGKPVLGKMLYKGEEMPFSQTNAAKFLAIKDFRNLVNVKSDDFRNFLEVVEKTDEKNSATTSTGT